MKAALITEEQLATVTKAFERYLIYADSCLANVDADYAQGALAIVRSLKTCDTAKEILALQKEIKCEERRFNQLWDDYALLVKRYEIVQKQYLDLREKKA